MIVKHAPRHVNKVHRPRTTVHSRHVIVNHAPRHVNKVHPLRTTVHSRHVIVRHAPRHVNRTKHRQQVIAKSVIIRQSRHVTAGHPPRPAIARHDLRAANARVGGPIVTHHVHRHVVIVHHKAGKRRNSKSPKRPSKSNPKYRSK